MTKKILTVAIAAVALTTASLAVSGDALAKGGKGGHHGHHHWGHGGVFISTAVVSSCWQWVETRRGLVKVYVCD